MKLILNSQDISYFIMLFSIVIGSCLLMMFLFIICLLLKCFRERRGTQRNRLSPQILRPGIEFFTAGAKYDPCIICLETYREGEMLRILACEHVYHMRCVDSWLLNSNTNCPFCKRRIRFDDSDSTNSKGSDTSSLHVKEESSSTPPPLQNPPLGTSTLDSSLLGQCVSDEFTEFVSKITRHCQNAAGDGGRTNLVAKTLGSKEISDHHHMTHRSMNNNEGDELMDALMPRETSTSSAVHA